MKFEGKIALWFWGIVIALNALFVYTIFFRKEDIVPMIIGAVICDVIFVPILVRNYVLLDDENLTLFFGFSKESLKISEITEIYETWNPIASSAASLDRIVVKTARSELMFSVKDKKGLFEELQKANPKLRFE